MSYILTKLYASKAYEGFRYVAKIYLVNEVLLDGLLVKR